MAFQIANQTSTALNRLIPTPGPWVRPADWLTITDAAGEVQFLMSNAASSYAAIATTFTRGATGNIYIDWGDGITDTISTIASTTTNHTYGTGGTPSSLGYDMWTVRVYGDAGTTITNTKIVAPSIFNSVNYPSSVLEAVYGNGTQTVGFGSLFFSGGSVTFPWLQYIKMPTAIPASFNGDFAFRNLSALRKIILPTSTGASQVGLLLGGCTNLTDLTMCESMPNCISFSEAFSGCYSLTSITLPPLPNCVTLSDVFNSCTSLSKLVLPATPKVSNWTRAFNACRSLLFAEINAWPTAVGAITFNSTFASCSSLEYIKLPASGPTGGTIDMTSAFSGCQNLKSINLSNYTGISSLNSTFASCASLASCILPTTASSLTQLNSTFSGCSTLQQITLPTTIGATVDLAGLFNGCFELGQITIPSSYNITSLNLTFQNCVNARTITLPNNTQNGITSLLTTFNGCINLRTLTLPTSMTAVTSMANCFQNCYNLTSIALPTTMNSCTTMSAAFNNCYSLTSLTLPTSMTSLTTFASAFQLCYALKSITLPATTGLITTYASAFTTNYSLTSITFPTGPTATTLASMNSMLNITPNLTTLTNTDKLGNSDTSAANVTYIDGTNLGNTSNNPTLDFYCKFSRFTANGAVGILNNLTSLRLRNNGPGQYGGVSPQINISYTRLSQAALVQVFNDLPTVTAKTINITGSSGAAALTAPERAIATGKGWTITG